MAPNTTGVATVDQPRSIYLAELALDFADQTLKPGGALLMKTFQGEGYSALYQQMRRGFEKLVSRKPRASRVIGTTPEYTSCAHGWLIRISSSQK